MPWTDFLAAQSDLGLLYLQLNLNSLNTDGLFSMADSNLFSSRYTNFMIAQEN